MQCKPCPPCATRPPKLFVYDIQKKMVRARKLAKRMKKHPEKRKKVDSAVHFELPKMSVIRSTNQAFVSQTVDLSKFPMKIVTSSPKIQGETGRVPLTMTSPLKMEVIMFNPKKYLENTLKMADRMTVNGDTDEGFNSTSNMSANDTEKTVNEQIDNTDKDDFEMETETQKTRTIHPNKEVRSFSPAQWKSYVKDLLNNYVEEIEKTLTARVALKDRDKALQPFTSATSDLRGQIDRLEEYAIISPELFECLTEFGFSDADKIDRTMEKAAKLKEISDTLVSLTQTTNFSNASDEIHGIYKKLLAFCNRLGIPFDQWDYHFEQIIEENDKIKLQLHEAELKLNLQNLRPVEQPSPTSSIRMLYGDKTPRESRRAQTAQMVNGIESEFQPAAEFLAPSSSALPQRQSNTQDPSHLQSENTFYYGERVPTAHYHHGLYPSPMDLYLKSQTLPPLEPFAGHGDQSFSDFITRFESKYSSSIFNDSERKSVFLPLLEKKAKRCYQSLDPDLQKSDLSTIIAALAPLLRKDEQIESLKAMQELDQLKLENNMIVRYCNTLEKLTRLAHPSMSSADLSFIRASHLYKQIMRWPRAVDALRMLERNDRASVYKDIKDLVFECDRNRQNCQNMLSTGSPSTSRRGFAHGQGQRQQPQPRNGVQPQINHQGNSLPTCHACGQTGHFRQQCPQAPRIESRPQQTSQHSNRFPNHNGQQQRNQGVSNYQRQNPAPQNSRPFAGSQQPDNRPPRVNVMEVNKAEQPPLELLKNVLGITTPYQVNAVGTEELPYFGKKPTYDVEVGTYKCTGLVDSGAQPSVMSVEVYKNMVLSLESPKDHVEVLNPLTTMDSNIVDASGFYMEVKAQIAVNVKLLHTGREGRIVFHLVKSTRSDPPNEIIIGTNAFKTLGIELLFKPPEIPTQQVKKTSATPTPIVETEADATSRNGQPVLITKRMAIEPNESRWITLQIERNDPNLQNKTLFVTPVKDSWGKPLIADSVCNFNSEGKAKVLVNNATPQVMILRKGQIIGDVTETNEIYSISTLRLQEIFNAPSCGEDETFRGPPRVNCIQQEKKEERIKELIKTAEKDRDEPLPTPIIKILTEYENSFALTDSELKHTHLMAHDIETGEARPIRQKLRPIPAGVRKEFREIIDGLLEKKIIEPSQSPWASPIVLVKKKDGSIRLCIDYRELNKVIKLDSYPLPPINSILQALAGRKFFSTLDLCSGFWQIRLADNAKEKTAFISSLGLFQFRVLPFGLSTSPATFQRLLDTILHKFDKENREVFCYIDDILIATTTEDRHYTVLEEVLIALQEANLAVKLKKCKFLEHEVTYLGHVVDGAGIHTDPEKVKAIKEAEPPKNLKDLRSFLGLAGYYRRFVLKFAAIAHPLFQLTKNGTPYRWTEECNRAFEDLKEKLCSSPILIQPDIPGAISGENGFQIYTDASGKGIGAVLCQLGEDKLLHPLWFVSRSLTKAEGGYHISDLEALAIVFALQKFQSLIYNMRNTVVKTDHLPLLCLFKKNISARMLRWSLLIQHYDVRIEYVKGQGNIVADALSRGLAPPNPETVTSDQEVCEDLATKVVGKIGHANKAQEEKQSDDEKNWLAELSTDTAYAPLIRWLRQEEHDIKGNETLALQDGNQKLQYNNFIIDEENLWLITEENNPRRVVPQGHRRRLFTTAHEGTFSGHFSPKKILKLLKTNFYWENMMKDITIWHKDCVKCYLTNLQDKLTPPLKPIVTTRPYEIIGIDTMELGITTNGNRYVLVIIDHFSKWMGAYAIPDKTAETVARTIVERWIGEGRWPTQFLSDQGSEFLNETLEKLRNLTKIKWTVTKGYCPRENGITERANKTLQRSLKKLVEHPAGWDNLLPFVVYAYNTTAHESTNETPFFLLHGFDAPLPFRPDKESTRPTYQLVDYSDYKEALVDAVKEARDLTIARNQKEQERHTAYYNKKHHTDGKTYPKTGDRVFMRLPSTKPQSKHPKLTINVQGPYRVIEASQNSALITLINHNEEPIRVQHDLLILLPAGLAAPEFDIKLRRKNRPKLLNYIGLEGKTTKETQANLFICRVSIMVHEDELLHPDFVCPGETTEEGRLICPISTTTIADIGKYFGYRVPEVMAKETVSSIALIAIVINILEDHTVHYSTKIQLLRTFTTDHIDVDSWARSYKIAADRCPHLEAAIQKITPYQDQLRFEPSLHMNSTDSAQLRSAIERAPSIKAKKMYGGRDLLLLPHHYLLEKMNQIAFQFCDIKSYGQDVNGALGSILLKDYRQVFIVLPPNLKSDKLKQYTQKMQQIGAVSKTLVIILPGLVLKNLEDWKADTNNTFDAWKEIKDTSCRRGENLHVFYHGPPHNEPILMGNSWSILGENLEKRRPVLPLELSELAAYWDKLHEELQANNINSGFRRQEKRKMADNNESSRKYRREDAVTRRPVQPSMSTQRNFPKRLAHPAQDNHNRQPNHSNRSREPVYRHQAQAPRVESLYHSTSIELSRHLADIINSQESFSRIAGEKETSQRMPSTIPTATPPATTVNPLFRIKFTSYKKKRKLGKKITVPQKAPVISSSSTASSPTTVSSTATEPTPFPTLIYVKENITDIGTSRLEPRNEITLDANTTAEEVKVIPTGYKTNPNFSPDEVPIEDESCNDQELQKILVEGMKFDDSVMSKRSIGAILSSTKRNNISVLCSETEVAFRLVARKHCQLSAGKATCVLFVL